MEPNNLTTKSKFLSLILRHNPKKIGIVLDDHGWANVAELCSKMPISKDHLDEIVRTDSKGRYSYSDDGMSIRANQGHSINVDVELEKLEPPEFLWHGTATKSMNSILKDGLKPMSRQYVHLSLDKETATTVGSRHGEPVLLKIKAKEMYNNGHKFFRSKNGVWLVLNVPALYIVLTGWTMDRDTYDERVRQVESAMAQQRSAAPVSLRFEGARTFGVRHGSDEARATACRSVQKKP